MIGPEHEGRRPADGAGFADAVTFSWGDPESGRYGFARLGIAGGTGSALAVAFAEREPVGVIAQGGIEVPAGGDWSLAMGGLEFTTEAPLSAWGVRGDLGGVAIDLRFEALGPPAQLDEAEAVAAAGGMEGYEQPCRVRGSVGGTGFAGVGQRGHQWGTPDWDRIALARSVSAWTADGRGVALSAVRPTRAKHHADEAVWAALLDSGERVADPRLSTTYDGEGRQRRAGLELWVHDDDPFPRRVNGEAVCGSTLDLGQLRLDCAFFSWRVDGDDAVGRYDVLRRA